MAGLIAVEFADDDIGSMVTVKIIFDMITSCTALPKPQLEPGA